ncbi:hypothetical protein NM208_g15652 [Fusarium decemcellulare]|uniref:Uncharacterized protein n=1 Tax=Fusarium decemcellulare TaxID=57161 RepID=A0ACC1RF21_9HYPO|nr:hypothetical protein NM208_g15652 [Fusarium decemcellulare]
MASIEQRIQYLSHEAQRFTQLQYDEADGIIGGADAEIARYTEILQQLDELEVDFDRIAHIKEIVKGYRANLGLLKLIKGRQVWPPETLHLVPLTVLIQVPRMICLILCVSQGHHGVDPARDILKVSVAVCEEIHLLAPRVARAMEAKMMGSSEHSKTTSKRLNAPCDAHIKDLLDNQVFS